MKPNSSAPSNWPANPAEIMTPICGGVSFQSGTMTGRIDAMTSASKASKKVATPTMIRALTCHHDVGRRSNRATISSTDERVLAASMCPSPGFLRAAGCSASARQFQEFCRGVSADVISHLVVERHAVDEMRGLLARLEGIVGGEHHVVVAERGDRAGQWFRRAHARRRHHEIVLDVLRRRLGELDAVEL